ncbi:hypothetical protein LO762_24540 [Actinocorallia sp. API 0066]|uniref:hypothetical protein n=1 Tax=Actinocorallia sp. API 0066 TaxID=2896846 RepID=UPI001E49D2A5|nr:hypothetical protein [Actinocorallia sp. API 0066]MCD0452336.1 hypothetical protein [Actinocorallia sp. API 0066]
MLTPVSTSALTRGKPGRATPEELQRFLLRAWILAFSLKLVGSSWDVSWHFKWLRDDFAPPHLLNSAGTVIAMALVGLHWYTGYGLDKIAKRFVEVGMAAFMIAIPIDVVNHRINGLDITAWSSSHALLYIGTGLMLIGMIRASTGVRRAVFFAFFLENWHFPALHQEYGVYALKAWYAGNPEAEPSLLSFAAQQMGRPVDDIMVEQFAQPVSYWVYPLWTGIGAMLILVLARRFTGLRWTATCVAAGYLAYRAVTGVLLGLGGFPHSAWPFFLVVGAVVIDLSFRYLPRLPVVGALLTVGALSLAFVAQGWLWEAPPYAMGAWTVAAGVLAVCWHGLDRFFPEAVREPQTAV